MRIEEEWSNAKCHYSDPEIDQMWHPQCQRDVEQHAQGTHAQVDAGSSEARVKFTEWLSNSCETSSGGNVSSSSKGQVAQDRMSVNLSGENLEYR
jgi:hypothetical protein